MSFTALRNALTCVGQTAFGAELAGVGMFIFALTRGVHCPSCDQLKLGTDFSWWQGYFGVIDLLQVCGLAFGLISLLGAHRRRWGAASLVLGLLAILFRPM